MKNKLLFTFSFMCLAALSLGVTSIHSQGIGDRNRAGSTGKYSLQGKVYLPDGRPATDAKVSISGADFTNASTRTDQHRDAGREQ